MLLHKPAGVKNKIGYLENVLFGVVLLIGTIGVDKIF